MPYCLGCGALFTPRLVMLLVFLFSDYLERAVTSGWLLLVGFIFLPLTTLCYAWIINSHGKVEGVYIIPLVLAVLIDVGLLGSTRRRRAKED